ncbi:hypothetical protein M569_04266, partial [Genlisea aurea]
MEPPRGFWASFRQLIIFLLVFTGLLVLGLIKGILLSPVIFLIIKAGAFVIILGLLPVHFFYTYYCILSTKMFGPALKIILCICILGILFIWPPIAFGCSQLFGAVYGFLAPMFATFRAVEEGRSNKLYHCICDGTLGSILASFTVLRDFFDVCFYSYFSIMDDLRRQQGKYYEIRLLYVLPSLIGGILGIVIDLPVITVIALCKSPIMFIKGWVRLFHDCIGREGPFLETICVPFAGLAILLWPLAVVGAILGSIVSSIFLGAYAAAVVYRESSFYYGLCYIVASLSIYDEYSNDVLDMPEGSFIPRPQYSKNPPSRNVSPENSFSRRSPPRLNSLNPPPMVELKALELANSLFDQCYTYGEYLAGEGIITWNDIEDAKNNKDNGDVITIGLPAYCLLQTLVISGKANSSGLVLNGEVSEITPSNRPKDTFFDWFLNPLLIIKDQISAHRLSESEEQYLGMLVLLGGDQTRLDIAPKPESELRRAELDALARRLRGITKSISLFPTFRRRFESIVRSIYEDLRKDNEPPLPTSRSVISRMFSQKS